MPASQRLPGFVAIALLAALGLTQTASARPGSLDQSFGNGGVVTTSPAAGTLEKPSDLAMTPDGGHIVVGRASAGPGSIVFKYGANGQLDPDFGDQGQIRTSGSGWDQAEVLDDGRVLLASGEGGQLVFERLGTDGAPDTDFGETGKVVLSTSGLFSLPDGLAPDASISSLHVLPDGSLRALGSFAGCLKEGYDICAEAFVAGVDEDGSPETDFGSTGIKNIGLAGNGIASVTFPTGNSLVLRSQTGDPPYGDGLFSTAISATGVPGSRILLPLDDMYYWSTLDERSAGVTLDSSGRVLFTDGSFLWRILPNGDRDPDFGEDGRVLLRDLTRFIPGDPGFYATDVAVDEQGRILLSGGPSGGSGDDEWRGDTWASTGAVARLNPDGSVDNSFGGGGLQILWHGSRARKHLIGDTSIVAVDGGLVVAGLGPSGEDFSFTLARATNGEMAMPKCGGKETEYLGFPDSDHIQAYDAVVKTSGGDDSIEGGFGSVICSGSGADSIELKRGPSTVFGGDGDDHIVLGDGENVAHGGAGNDLIKGGLWRDRLLGDAGDDLILGGNRDDRLFGGPGKDRLFGQGGRDWLFGGDGKDALDVGPVKPDPTDYLATSPGRFVRVTTLGRKASTLIRISMVCDKKDKDRTSLLTMRSIPFDAASGDLSNVEPEHPPLDDDFVFIADVEARVSDGRVAGRYRYISGENYYDHYLCRTGSGPVVEETALRDAWVKFSAEALAKPRQIARQD